MSVCSFRHLKRTSRCFGAHFWLLDRLRLRLPAGPWAQRALALVRDALHWLRLGRLRLRLLPGGVALPKAALRGPRRAAWRPFRCRFGAVSHVPRAQVQGRRCVDLAEVEEACPVDLQELMRSCQEKVRPKAPEVQAQCARVLSELEKGPLMSFRCL